MESDVPVPESALRMRVIDSLATVLSRVLRYEVGAVSEATRLRDELGLTSASTMELLFELEDRLAIEVDVEELDEPDVESVGSLADYIVAHSRTAW
jgi:acyl carrier protein